MKLSFFLVLIALFVGPRGLSQRTYQYVVPQNLNDGWEVSDLNAQEVDLSRFNQLFTQIGEAEHKLHSVLVVRDGKLVLEEYFDENTVDSTHDLRSVTKSFTSLLMGIAIDKGFINSIDDPISKYVSDPIPKKNIDPRKQEITIRHLLTMSTGLDCNDWDQSSKGQEDKVYRKSNWLQYFLDLPMLHNPGEVSNYCTMGQIFANEIIANASGMPIDEFAEKYLFKPLNISEYNWGHTSNKEVIASGKRLYMRPRDMAKIGKLILNKGSWNDELVVSQKWVESSTSAQTKITERDYGYFWWNIPLTVKDKEIIIKTATGNGGQYIFIDPKNNVVAIFTGGAYNSAEGQLPFAIMRDIILYTFSE